MTSDNPTRLPIAAFLTCVTILAGCASAIEQGGGTPGATPAAREIPASHAAPLVAATAQAGSRVQLAPNHPDRHTVVRGDTLWGISGMFLRDPWLWPEIWYVNPQIDNPHLIYPGDVIYLVWVDGQPQLRLDRGSAGTVAPPPGGTNRLSPQIRTESLDRAITTIPYEAIAPFLSRPTVLSKKQVKDAPYVLSMRGGHLVAGEGFELYARGADFNPGANYSIFDIRDVYRDPENGKVIGHEALYVGQGRVIRGGDPATLALSETRREALAGNRLLPVETDIPLNFYPSAPREDLEGQIVDVIDGVSIIGQYQVVVLNRGIEDGLVIGNVLDVWQSAPPVRDHIAGTGLFGLKRVELPQENAGRIMVFRVLDGISFGLVMHATSEIHVADFVRTP